MIRTSWQVLREVGRSWSQNKAPQLGAALAYYTVFSLAPLLLVAIGLASLAFDETAARGKVLSEIENAVGAPTRAAIESVLSNASCVGGGEQMTIVGLATLMFGASGVFLQLQDALNTIWGVPLKPRGALLGFVRNRLISFVVVLGTGVLLLGSVVLSSLLAALGKLVTTSAITGNVPLWQATNAATSFVVISLLFGMIYKLLPDARIAWRDVLIGAVLTSLLFTLGKNLIGLYLGRNSVTSTFGAAGSLVLILLWVYYSSLIFLLGAEITHAYALICGSRSVSESQRSGETV